MFRSYPYTFTTDEAAAVMSSLVFIHIHRHPDPLDPLRHIATRTTTTFSMDYATAKNLIQHFLSARLITSATDSQNLNVRDRGVWCPTLKGKYVLEEFTDYTQVDMTENLIAALNAPYMQLPTSSSGSTGSRLIHLDRLTDNDDQITFSRPNMTAAFKAMMSSLPQDALLVDEISGIDKRDIPTFQHTFVGMHCIDWLWDRLTVTSKEEAKMVAEEFILFGWIALVLDKSDKELSTNDDVMSFKTSRKAIYYVTDRGCSIIGWKKSKQKRVYVDNTDTDVAVALAVAVAVVEEESDASSLKKTSMRKVVINTGKSSKMALENAKYDFYLSNPESISSAEMSQQNSDIFFAEEQPESLGEHKILDPLILRPSNMALTDSSMSHASTSSAGGSPDNSQHTRLNQILENPLLRLYFRDFLRSNYCVENINFWVDYHLLLKNIGKKTVLDQISECYSIYETYLGPAADVNIDYTLCQEIIKYVSSVFIIVSQLPPSKEIPYFMLSPNTTPKNYNKPAKSSARLLLMPPETNSAKQRIVTIRGTTIDKCLSRLLHMFARVNEHVFGMMAEDSLPKFVKTTVYKDLMIRQQQQQQELQDIVSEDGYDEDDEDSEQDEIIHVITALSDQRISLENNRNHPLKNTAS